MPRIKVTINGMRLNLARVIEAIKACRMQKFETGSLSSFGDMTSQNFPLEKRKSH